MNALRICVTALLLGCNQPDVVPQPSATIAAQTVASALALSESGAVGTTTMTAASSTAMAMPMPTDATPPSSLVRLLGTPPLAVTNMEPLPVAGVPHLYHEGAAAFFLDHSELALTPEQRTQFGQLREGANLSLATSQRKIDQAEQDLWQLTSSEKPDAARIQAKLDESARLTAQQRMDYARAIGQSVALLSDTQKHALTATSASMPMTSMTSMPMTSMPMPTGTSAMPMTAGSGMKMEKMEMGMRASGGGMGMMKGMKGGAMAAPTSSGMGVDAGASMGGAGMGHM